MRILLCAGAALAAIPLFASDYAIAIRVEPPQAVKAITIRSGDVVRSVTVRDGKVFVPADVSLPWTVGMNRFEPVAYTRQDLEKRTPLVLRELGVVQGTLRRSSPPKQERFTWILRRSNTETVDAVDVDVSAQGRFELRVPAGLYEGAALGPASGTRIRSGLVIEPGRTTDLGTLLCEPTVPLSLRIIDGRSGAPVAGARVLWDPPPALNANTARILYAKRWSTATDSRGMAAFGAIGPLPIPVRWRIDAGGYSTQWTARQLTANDRIALPDVRLQREPALLLRVRFVRERNELKGASIVIAEPDADMRTRRFVPVAHAPLREGELRLPVRRYGRTRILVETPAGKPLLYRDVEVDADTVPVDLALEPLEIHGRITRRDQPVKAQVWLYDPQDSRVLLAKTAADDDGEYSLITWQTGELRLRTLEGGGAGKSFGTVSKTLTTDGRNDYRVDFDLFTSGLTLRVIDSASRAPLKAAVETRIALNTGNTVMGGAETDEQGRLAFSGYSDGTARLHIAAKGHRARDLEIPLNDSAAETVVALDPSQPIYGRVLDTNGTAVAGARITGGYRGEDDMQAPFIAETDANGRFELDSTPEPGTRFYIAAARSALGIATLQAGRENVVVLHPPSPGVVSLRPNDAIPTKTCVVLAAPVGGTMIPFGALDDLADANGISPYQLQGSQKDGSVVLPQFLQPGTYDIYLAHKGGKLFLYERIGAVTLPMQRNVVLAYPSK